MEISSRNLVKILGYALAGVYILLAIIMASIPLGVLMYTMLAGYFFNRRVCAFGAFDSAMLAPLSMIAIITIASAPVLYFSNLTPLSIALILSVPVLIGIFFPASRTLCSKKTNTPIPKKTLLLCIISLALSASSVAILFSSQTTETSLGPWDAVSPIFFIAVFLNLCALLAAGMFGARKRAILPAISAFVFSIASVLAIVYPLGFGFDPLLHNAAQKIIFEHGALLPKTPYYNGHYGLMVILAKLFHAPLELFNRFLIVSIAALSLPLLLSRVIEALSPLKNSNTFVATILVLSLAPLSPVYTATPWGYAFFLALIAILASILFFIEKNNGLRYFAFLAAFALFAVHPLAGLPILGFLAVSCFKRPSMILAGVSPFISAAALMASFFILSSIQLQLAVAFTLFNFAALKSFLMSGIPHWEWRFNALLDPEYLFSKNIFILFFGGALFSVLMARTFPAHKRRAIFLLALGFCGAALSFIAAKAVLSFPSLPVYEQTIYADRIKEISMLFLSVLSGAAFVIGVEKIKKQKNRFLIFIAILVFSALGAMMVYSSYPRNDAYIPYHGYTISRHDIDAVRWIESDASGKEYAVLANQTTAAASIKEFGFAKYFPVAQANDLPYQAFYYSIPASSPLSDAFVKMLSSPSREIIDNVVSLTGVKRVYVVIHSYEPRFRNNIDKIKPIADAWYSVDNEKVSVFVFIARE